jgi:hypothetical protein
MATALRRADEAEFVMGNTLLCGASGVYQGQSREESQMSDSTHKDLPPAAQRALAEAEARREKAEAEAKTTPKELGGRDGPEPVRYGDWEKKGIAIDF